MSESVCPIQNLMRSSRHKYLGLAGVSTAFRYWIFHIWADAKEVIAYERKQESVYYEYFAKMESRLEKFERDEGRSFQMPNKTWNIFTTKRCIFRSGILCLDKPAN
jgi:hypothetical protein